MASEAPTQSTASAPAPPHIGDISLPDADDAPVADRLDVNTSDSSDEEGSEEDDEDAPRVFTAGERVEQLNAIDKDIAQILSSASLALQNANDKEAFTAHTQRYMQLVNSITVGIRRQLIALEQADLVVGGAGSDGVGRQKEAELWQKARSAVEGLGKEQGGMDVDKAL